jgi:hypothetical protein
MLARVSQLREDACAAGAVGGDLALVLVGQQRQGRGQVEGRLRQGYLEQEAHGPQTQGQHRQRGPGRVDRADVSTQVLVDGGRGPPLSPQPTRRVGER